MFWENESDESAKERVVVVGGGRGWRWGWFNGVVSMVVLGISIRPVPDCKFCFITRVPGTVSGSASLDNFLLLY